eukprot:1608184-Pyramimonas_sp.AAC.2
MMHCSRTPKLKGRMFCLVNVASTKRESDDPVDKTQHASSQNSTQPNGKASSEDSIDWEQLMRAVTLPFRVPAAVMKVPVRRAIGRHPILNLNFR